MKEIARVVGVSLSSVSYWVRDVQLTSEQREALFRRMSANGRAAAAAGPSRAAREVRRSHQQRGRRQARRRRLGHVAGCMLYWAEGSKGTQLRPVRELRSGDGALLRALSPHVLRRLRRGTTDPLQSVRRSHRTAARNRAVLARHARASGVLPPQVDSERLPKYSKKKRQGRLPYGTVRVCVHSTAIVQSIYGAIQEYGGFERPKWLG
jgi:hypothetical protein